MKLPHPDRAVVDIRKLRGRQVRSGWMVRPDEDFPRLTTCYVVTTKPSRR